MPKTNSFESSLLSERTNSGVKIDWRNARVRELATFDENRRSVEMLNAEHHLCAKKNQGPLPGCETDDTRDHGLSKTSLKINLPTSGP